MKKRIISLMLAAIMVLSLAACAGGNTESGENTETYIFTDDAGREVEIPKEITSIVPTAPLAQIILYAIASDMFVGVASEFYESSRGIIPDEMFELHCFGSLYADADLNLEELALTAPQLIIDVGEPKKTTKEDLDALQEQTLIPTVYIASSMETMPETYRKLGKLLGREEKGEKEREK